MLGVMLTFDNGPGPKAAPEVLETPARIPLLRGREAGNKAPYVTDREVSPA